METKEMKDLLLGRLYIELQLFRHSILQCTKEEIYSEAYKIETFVNMYKIFQVDIEKMSEEIAYTLLNWPGGILEYVYQEWIAIEDSTFDELKACIDMRLYGILQKANIQLGKENNDGAWDNKAA